MSVSERLCAQLSFWGGCGSIRVHDYGEMVSSAHPYHFMADIQIYFARVTSVPVEHHSVTKAVELLGTYERRTMDGSLMSNLRSMKFICIHARGAGMHTDNVYETTGLQFLHCLETSVGGGILFGGWI